MYKKNDLILFIVCSCCFVWLFFSSLLSFCCYVVGKLRALRDASKLAMSGKQIYHGMTETALTTSFELLNLVPNEHPYLSKPNDDQATSTKSTSNHKEKRSTPSSNGKGANVITTTKWRRVGLVSASSVRLDTIVWPGGDIVVSGRYFHYTCNMQHSVSLFRLNDKNSLICNH